MLVTMDATNTASVHVGGNFTTSGASALKMFPTKAKKRLRVLSVVIQPVVVWDDDDVLSTGPEMEAVTLDLLSAHEMLDGLADHIDQVGRSLTKD